MLSPTNKFNQRGASRLVALCFLLVWLIALALIAFNRQNIIDWWRLRNYQAPAAVAQLATEDTMTDYARKVFYVNRPILDDKAAFNEHCPTDAAQEQTIVLGCYLNDQTGIFLLEVNDPRLEGVEQVTAAHELLHAAFDRLNVSEQNRIEGLLVDYYKRDLRDQRVVDTIAAYKKSEPNDVVNEMHSVFGTEVASLPAELEQYYKRYFTNRGQVVAFAAQYQAAFTSRQTKVAQYDAQLTKLKAQITAAEQQLKSRLAEISAQQDKLNSLRDSGSVAAYNAAVPTYNNLVDAYNREVAGIKDLEKRYNQIVATRNAVVLEQDQLSKELNSNVEPINR